MLVDLHTHSIYSDGTKSPEELINLAKSKNIKILAITDHDDIEGSKKLVAMQDKNIMVYSGVELSAEVTKGQMHILGYNFDLENEELNLKLKELRELSIEKVKLYLKQLKDEFNIILPNQDENELLNGIGRVGRPRLALLLVKYNFCQTVSEAFTKYLYDSNVRKTTQNLKASECISLINKAGGIPVLAHPWSIGLTEEELHKELSLLVEYGLQGIEVFHSKTAPEQTELYHRFAQEFSLLETGGTDFHGEEVKPGIELGTGLHNNVKIEEDTLTFIKRIKSRY